MLIRSVKVCVDFQHSDSQLGLITAPHLVVDRLDSELLFLNQRLIMIREHRSFKIVAWIHREIDRRGKQCILAENRLDYFYEKANHEALEHECCSSLAQASNSLLLLVVRISEASRNVELTNCE